MVSRSAQEEELAMLAECRSGLRKDRSQAYIPGS